MSTKSVVEKLMIKPGTAVWSSDSSRRALIGPLPQAARHVDALGDAEIGVVFAESADALREILTAHKGELAAPASLWIAYPKANRADINRDSLWPILGEYGMRPIGQVAIDDVWSALRFRALAAGEAPFTGGKS